MPRSPSSTQETSSGALTSATGTSAERHEAPAHHRHALDMGVGGLVLQKALEGIGLLVRDVEEEEARRLLRQALRELARQVAVDDRERHEERDAEAEREHQRGRERARAVDVGKRQPRRRSLRTGKAAGERHDAERDEAQEHEGAGRGAHEHERDALVIGREQATAPPAPRPRPRARRGSACAASAAPDRSGRGTGLRPARHGRGPKARWRRPGP